MAQNLTRRAVIYRRISNDATGEAAGVTRQREDCERYCSQRNWTIVADLEDNDISASRYSVKNRPAYQQSLKLIETGEADVLVAWHLDRLWRRPAELEHLIDLVEKRDILVATLNGEIDLNSGDGRFQARILVSVSAKASDDASRRLKRAALQRAEHGEPHGHLAFGWKPGGIELDATRAAIVRDLVDRYLSGEAVISLARSLNDRGVPSSHAGVRWTPTVVRGMLLNPRLAGLRIHRGEVIGEGRWEPIIDRATHAKLIAMSKDRRRHDMNPPRRRLLTGLVRCGRCGSKLTYAQAGKMRCNKQPGFDNCGSVSIRSAPLEAILVEAIMLRMDSPALAQQVAESKRQTVVNDDISAQIANLEGRQAELAELWAAGDLGTAEWSTARRALEGRLEPLRRRYGTQTQSAALAPYAAGGLRAAWPQLPLDTQRGLIAAVIDEVTIAPATKRGPIFDTERIDLSWRV